ncbi:hypothetical protein OIV83_000073 [Microbotryomycetes sp. JL201]|nr:hypothetical protein OIV83_000073 [Microbotryomycetes sp. JL201]
MPADDGPDDQGHDELSMYSREQLLELLGLSKQALDDLQAHVDELERERDGLTTSSTALQDDLEAAKQRVDELLNDQARMEEELAGRMEVLDKLRTQVKELERDRRDTTKRYREQADSFESERQSWYDQEQHYKLRITNLTQTANGKRNRGRREATNVSALEESATETDPASPQAAISPLSENAPPSPPSSPSQPLDERSAPNSPAPGDSDDGNTSTDVHRLEEQLESLSTAHESLTSTFRALQTELGDLKRMYEQVQDENQSYEMLLGERTLNGEVQTTDLFRRSFQWGDASPALGFSGGLEAVGEDDEYMIDDESDEDGRMANLEGGDPGSPSRSAAKSKSRRQSKMARQVGTGGMDLASELEAAQDEDAEAEQERLRREKAERRRASQVRRGSKAVAQIDETSVSELQNEVRLLREANKALTLYVSKIVDRVCSQEGFEKVLAVDYRQTPVAPEQPPPVPKDDVPPADATKEPAQTLVDDGIGQIKFRPNSLWKSSAAATSSVSSTPSKEQAPASPSTPAAGSATRKAWSSLLGLARGSSSSALPSPGTPNTSRISANETASSSARKLDTHDEDEDDLRERERLRAEMAMHGIQDEESGNQWGARTPLMSSPAIASTRATDRELLNTPPPPPKDLTPEERIQAEAVLQSRADEEAQAKSDLKQGKASGFTEPVKRPSIRSRASSSSASGIVGLGIVDPEPEQGQTVEVKSPKTESVNGGATPGDTWSKTFKRLSMGWQSPTP